MMRPRITFTSLLISLVMIGSWPASGISSLASLPTLERIEKKPSLSLHPKVDPKGFLLEYHRTKNHLIAGNLPAFEDGLVKLGSGLDRPQMMVQLYSLAVEADFSSNIDLLHFQQGLDRVKNVTIPMQVVVSRGLTPPDFNDDNWRWARANYHYSTRNSSALRELLGLRVKTDAAQDEDHLRGTLVDGYIESLLARLDNSLEYAKSAVTHLEMVAAPLVKNHTAGVRLGRISLHLGRVLLVQYSLSGESNRNELLENASYYARLARNGLELHMIPLFYSSALYLSADVLEEEIKSSTTMMKSQKEVLKYRLNRLRLLAGQYH